MLLALLALAFLLVLAPAWPPSRRWGYYPSGAMGAALLVALALLLLHRARI
jgi:hypothetical protein